MSHVSISQFHSGLGGDKHRKVCGRVTWTIINWSNWIYNGTVRKATENNPKYSTMYGVYISQFHTGLVWYKHRKV